MLRHRRRSRNACTPPQAPGWGSRAAAGSVRAQVVVAEPEPVHAGVDLEVIARAARPARAAARLQRPARRRRRDRRRQAVLEDAVEVADAERAEHEDCGPHAGRPQHDAFLDVGAREHRGARLLERERHRSRAVPVGVRLDDGDDAGGAAAPGPSARRASARKPAMAPVVRLQGGEVDVRDRAAGSQAPVLRRQVLEPVCSLRNASLTTPVGPLRCLPMMSSAMPWSSGARVRGTGPRG